MKKINVVNAHIGKKLKEIRLKKNFTLYEIAGALGLSHPSVVQIEKGRQRMSIEQLLKACSVLKCNIYDIVPKIPEAKFKKVLKKKQYEYKTMDVIFKW